MGRFLALWRQNPNAPWPENPSEAAELNELLFAGVDDLIAKGEIVEFGWFPDGASGYAISVGEITDVFRRVSMFQPYFFSEVHEIIPYEKGKEINREILQMRITMAKK
ncbi:MAG: hypothetical protein JSV05_01870 [Candidatus Bathyarchaeota archaeon]|nr:MAG: hypothetical protein JSV05_01870 [Candidatus Bathyarchaeota archaeon]